MVFGYVPEKNILNHISLYAKPGEDGLCRFYRAGKTTIINLINRFYEISAGSITYDGIDIRDIRKDDLRRSLSLVIQETHLLRERLRIISDMEDSMPPIRRSERLPGQLMQIPLSEGCPRGMIRCSMEMAATFHRGRDSFWQ